MQEGFLMSNIDLLKIEEAVKMILEAVGEDVNKVYWIRPSV